MTSPAPRVVSVDDRAASGQRSEALAAVSEVLAAFQAAGQGPRRPVRVVLEALAVPAFCETRFDAHVLHLQASAVAEPWFRGLLAREAAHMALSDTGHISHDPGLLQRSFEAAKERLDASGVGPDVNFLGVVGTMNHHVRDVYADALAHTVAPEALAAWLAHLTESWAPGERGDGDRAVELGYLAGTHRRLGLALPEPIGEAVVAQDGAGELADGFATLPPEPDEEALAGAMQAQVGRIPLPGTP